MDMLPAGLMYPVYMNCNKTLKHVSLMERLSSEKSRVPPGNVAMLVNSV